MESTMLTRSPLRPCQHSALTVGRISPKHHFDQARRRSRNGGCDCYSRAGVTILDLNRCLHIPLDFASSHVSFPGPLTNLRRWRTVSATAGVRMPRSGTPSTSPKT